MLDVSYFCCVVKNNNALLAADFQNGDSRLCRVSVLVAPKF